MPHDDGMDNDSRSPKQKAGNIVAEMRSRPRKPVEEPKEEAQKTSPLKGLFRKVLIKQKREKAEVVPAEEKTPPDSSPLAERNRKLAERLEDLEDRSWEIRESEELHRSLAEAFGDVILDRSEAGEAHFANSVARHYFDENCHLPEPEPVSLDDNAAPTTRDIEIETLQGMRWFSWTDIVVRDAISGQHHIRSVGRDITNRKRDEEMLAAALKESEDASAIKSRFLAMVSHEMRTPLNGIAGLARLLTDSDLGAAQRDHVDAIDRSGRTLLALVNDLLDTAQIEAGEMSLQPGSVDLRELVEKSAEMLINRAAVKGLTLSTFVDPDLPTNLHLDGERLQQIILNLGGNAVKFTQDGGVAIEVTGKAEETRTTITLSVSDSGPGLSAQDQKRIFAEFEQAEADSDRQHDGAGLGLFIAQQIAQLMNSTIEVSSIEGQGSRFQLTFEADVVSDGRRHAAPQANVDTVLIMRPSPARAALLRSIRSIVTTAHGFDSIETFQAASRRKEFDSARVLIESGLLSDVDSFGAQDLGLQNAQMILIDYADATKKNPASGKGGWLTWPVRHTSLQKLLLGQRAEYRPEPQAKSLQGNALNILLVEDNDINTLVATRFLERLDCTVTHAPDGHAALEAFSNAVGTNQHFDYVLLDLNMPDMNGWAVLTNLRDMESEENRATVIVLSADDRENTRKSVIEKGADGFLSKPLDFDAFCRLLKPSEAA